MSNDISISPISSINRPATFNKPSYLIIFEDYPTGKDKNKIKKFITIEQPDTLNAFIKAKGVLSEESEEEITSSYQDLLTGSKKEDILELMVPWNRVFSVKSLVFKAK